MPAPATALSDPPAGALAASPQREGDWARPLLDRHLVLLSELAEDGMQMARAFKDMALRALTVEAQTAGPQTTETQAEAPPLVDPTRISLAYARVTRAVRLALLLQAKLIGDLKALERDAAYSGAGNGARASGAQLEQTRKARIALIVGRVARMDGETEEAVQQAMRETGERLDRDEAYADLLARPVSELVALICQDLGLAPDWKQLADEAWALDETADDEPSALLAALASTAGHTAFTGAPPNPQGMIYVWGGQERPPPS